MACKAMRSVRHPHLVVHPSQDSRNTGMRCRSALTFLARTFGDAKLVDMKLLLKSDVRVRGFEKKLMRALTGGSCQLGGIVAFQFGLQEGPGLRTGLNRFSSGYSLA